MRILRWVLFLPAGIVASILASYVLRMGAFMFPEIARLLVSGFGGAAGLILGGLYVAPVRHPAVKWGLIIVAVTLGVISALGSLLAGDDKLEAAIGISMVIVALGFARVKTVEIIANAEQGDESKL